MKNTSASVGRAVLPALLTSLAVAAVACGGEGGPAGGGIPSPGPTGGGPRTYTQRPPLTIDRGKKYTALVRTVKGDFKIELRPDIAPETVNSFVFLARDGYYDGVTFHRVIPGFVAQTGDPTGTGSGGPGYTLPAEFSGEPYVRATVGMARVGNDPNSGGSQWFVAYGEAASLNGQYTVFGKVIEGMEVVDALTPRDPRADPNAPPGDAVITIEISEE